MDADIQPLEKSLTCLLITGNEPFTIVPVDEGNNKNEIHNYKHPPPSNDVEFDIPIVQVTVSHSDEEEYFTIDSQEMQPDQNPNDHDLPATPCVNYSRSVNAPADEVVG